MVPKAKQYVLTYIRSQTQKWEDRAAKHVRKIASKGTNPDDAEHVYVNLKIALALVVTYCLQHMM